MHFSASYMNFFKNLNFWRKFLHLNYTSCFFKGIEAILTPRFIKLFPCLRCNDSRYLFITFYAFWLPQRTNKQHKCTYVNEKIWKFYAERDVMKVANYHHLTHDADFLINDCSIIPVKYYVTSSRTRKQPITDFKFNYRTFLFVLRSIKAFTRNYSSTWVLIGWNFARCNSCELAIFFFCFFHVIFHLGLIGQEKRWRWSFLCKASLLFVF
jgi:hypothetical protein